MSPWVPIIFSVLCTAVVIAAQIYNKVTTPDETKEHLRKLRGLEYTIVTVVLMTVQVALLIREVVSKDPLTRVAVFSIASLVASILFMVQSFLDMSILRLINRIVAVQGRLIGELIRLAEDEAAKR